MSEAEAAPAIHPADPAVRRNALLLAPVSAALLYGVWYWFQSYMNGLSMEDSPSMLASSQRIADAIDYTLYGCAAMLGALTVYWFRLSRTVRAAPRYPLEQARLFHSMKILRGEAKQAYARRTLRSACVALTAALLFVVAGIEVPRYFARIHPIVANGGLLSHAPAAGGTRQP